MKLALDIPARVVLLPVLAGQAIAVRRRARFLPEPDGARSGVAGGGPPLRVLIVGDSSAAGVGAPDQAQGLSGQVVAHLAPHFRVTWRLSALTGNTTRDTLAALNDLPGERFDVAITALGVNDVTRMVTARQWGSRQNALFDLLAQRFGVQGCFVTGMPPMGEFPLLPQPLAWVLGQQAARFDRVLERLANSRPDVEHVQVRYPLEPQYSASDGYHPSPVAFALWGQHMAARILARFPP